MIGTLYTITNKAGQSFKINDHTTDPRNLIALQSYPNFDVDIKSNEIAKDGQHGSWDFFSYYGRRTIGFSGVIVGDNELSVDEQKQLMITVLGLPTQPTKPNDGYVYLTWTDIEGNDWRIECKLMNSIQFNRDMRLTYRLDFNFTLKAPDPFIYSNIPISAAGVRAYKISGGQFPLPLPAILGENDVNQLHITNDSTVEAQTIIRLYGEADGAVTNPRILNYTTGKAFYLDFPIADQNHWIEIDSKLGTVVDQDGVDQSSHIVGDSNFIVLAPGENTLVYFSDEDPLITLYNPSAPFTVAFRKTKI